MGISTCKFISGMHKAICTTMRPKRSVVFPPLLHSDERLIGSAYGVPLAYTRYGWVPLKFLSKLSAHLDVQNKLEQPGRRIDNMR
jgi:hypothetical protein